MRKSMFILPNKSTYNIFWSLLILYNKSCSCRQDLIVNQFNYLMLEIDAYKIEMSSYVIKNREENLKQQYVKNSLTKDTVHFIHNYITFGKKLVSN